MSIDIDWARSELKKFVELTTRYRQPPPRGVISAGSMLYKGGHDDIVASAYVIEKILSRLLPSWRETIAAGSYQWSQHRDAAISAIVVLDRDEELRRRLGDEAPTLSAGVMHPWVWDGAKALWWSGHFREAVTAAARQVNAETQNKVGRRDRSETKLFQSVFSADEPKHGEPRLRVMSNDGSDTYKSVHRGLMALAEGAFAAIRNPNSHEANLPELPEHEALEQLAVLSFLARRVDAATLAVA